MHFTYKEPDYNNLCQGDVLKITPELREIIKEVHPYFKHPQYKYFMVLTQSCDLVKRGNSPCKSPYITLAAIKSFDDFFKKEMLRKSYVEQVGDILLINEQRYNVAYQLIERIFNNTEPDYFFLYKEQEMNFPASMIVYLKVSIALKSLEHFDDCLSAKIIELSDEFKAKLGWLVGNIYSRVGTKDWNDICTDKERKEIVKNAITSRCIKGTKEQLLVVKEKLQNNELCNEEDIEDFIKSMKTQSLYEKIIEKIEMTINDKCDPVDDKEKQLIIKSLKSSSELKSLLAGKH